MLKQMNLWKNSTDNSLQEVAQNYIQTLLPIRGNIDLLHRGIKLNVPTREIRSTFGNQTIIDLI